VQFQLKGKLETGALKHELGLGLLRSRVRDRFDLQAYNYVGTGNLATLPVFAPDPAQNDQNTNRNETSTELSAYDVIAWTPRLSTWLGLRHTRLERDSVRTNGTRPIRYEKTSPPPGPPWATNSHPRNWCTRATAKGRNRRWYPTARRSTPIPARRCRC